MSPDNKVEAPTIECEEFYELCQQYRHTPVWKQKEVVEAYQNLIKFIDTHELALRQEEAEEWLSEYGSASTSEFESWARKRISDLKAGKVSSPLVALRQELEGLLADQDERFKYDHRIIDGTGFVQKIRAILAKHGAARPDEEKP